MICPRFSRAPWLSLATLLVLVSPAEAQEAQDAAGAMEAAPADDASDAIEVADVPSRAERDSAEIERLALRARSSDSIEEIAAAFPSAREELDLLARDPDLGDVEALPLRSVDDLHRRWEQKLESLERWGRTLHSRTERLDDDLTRLSRLEEAWRITLQVSDARDYPPALVEDMRELLRRVRAVAADVSGRRDAVAELQAAVAAERTEIDRVLGNIDQARAVGLARLTERETRPIWQSDDEDSARVSKTFEDSWEEHGAAAETFLRDHPPIKWKFLIFFLGASMLFVWIRIRRADWEISPDEELAVDMVARRPIVTAAIFALFLGFIGSGRSPLIILSGWLMVLALLTPIALRRVVHRDIWWVAVVASIFFGLERLVFLTRFVFADHRWPTIVLFASASLINAWLARPARRRVEVSGGAIRVGIQLVRLEGLVLLFACGAVALGWVRLGYILGAGTLATAMAAWGIYVGMKGTEAVVSGVLRSWPIGALPSIRNHREAARYQLGVLVKIGAVWLWLRGVLHFFRLSAMVRGRVVDFVEREIDVGDITIRPDQILLFIAFAFLTVLIARVVRVFLEEDLLSQIRLPQGVRETVSLVAWLSCLGGGMFISFASLGFNPESLTVLAGAVGVGLGFGLQDLVKNFAAGIILLIERPVRVGDAVEVGALKGRVRGIGIRSSVIRTYQGAEVIVPNGMLASREVTNWTRSDLQRRLEVEVCVPHHTVAEEAIDALVGAGLSTPGLIVSKKPAVIFLGSDNTGLRFSLRCWTEDYDNWLEIWSDLTVRAHRGLREAGIPIAIPRRQVASTALYEDPVGAAVAGDVDDD